MKEKIYKTSSGTIHYWVNDFKDDRLTIAFLPGLTADHRLFDKQIEYFNEKYNVFVWDAPGHALSRPFLFDFSIMDKARWLREIMNVEKANHLVIVGQSMGGYIGQVYTELFPQELEGFVSIDSCPLQKRYLTALEIWLLKHVEPIYKFYPWKSLVKTGSNGVAVSEYGRSLMKDMMMVYDNDHMQYVQLVGHGYRILGEAYQADLAYEFQCPVLLICGKQDKAGSAIRYNRSWEKNTGYKVEWIENAGHNANTDQPERINHLIHNFLQNIVKKNK